jgi:hypothetical protein
MLSSVDHYTLLLRAVARLDRASYEARGAIYDRALSALIKRLRTAAPPYSEADIDRELLAFRQAVRRVEFGDLDERERFGQQAPADRSVRVGSRGDPRQDLDQALQYGVRQSPLQRPRRAPPPAAAIDEPPALQPEPMPDVQEPLPVLTHRRGLFARVAGRVALAALVAVVGIAGYAYRTGQFEPSAWSGLLARAAGLVTGSATEATESAIYYEQAERAAPWQQFAGKARWHSHLEKASGGSRQPVLVLTAEVQVPDRGMALTMSIRRDAGDDAAITHLVDLKFTDADGAPLHGVTSVANIVMKQADGTGSVALAGRSIRVAPGLYLFGLSAEKQDAQHNAEALRSLPRFEIPFAYATGATGVISVTKGASGERAFREAFASWAR